MGIAVIPVICASLYVYTNLKIKHLRVIIANSTLQACINIIQDLCKINMFYDYIKIKSDEYNTYINATPHLGNKKNPYINSTKKQNSKIVELENMVYNLLYKLLKELDYNQLPGKAPFKEKVKTFIESMFDFKNPQYVFDESAGTYIRNSAIPDNEQIKFRYTTERCNIKKISTNLVRFNTKNNMDKLCNNYNDIIVRTMERKFERFKFWYEHSVRNVLASAASFIPDPFATTNLNIMIRNYTVLGINYSLVIGRYLIHSNECAVIPGFNSVEDPIYNRENSDTLDKIGEFFEWSKICTQAIMDTNGSAEDALQKEGDNTATSTDATRSEATNENGIKLHLSTLEEKSDP